MKENFLIGGLLMSLLFTIDSSMSGPLDPYLWLEEIQGKKSQKWVQNENKLTFDRLGRTAHFKEVKDQILSYLGSPDKIPHGILRGQFIYGFWQDEVHPKGIWRRASLKEYLKKDIRWEVLLDLDQLSEKEHENWMWKGSECSRENPSHCFISLSRDGKDASVRREFNLETKTFLVDGFSHSESKGFMNWYDKNNVIIGINFGPDSLTKSGYPRILKKWKRGEDLGQAKTLFEGKENDLGVWFYKLENPSGSLKIIENSLSYYNSHFYALGKGDQLTKLPLPQDAVPYGLFDDKVLVLLRSDWGKQGRLWKQGTLLALEKEALLAGEIKAEILFEPSADTFIEEIILVKKGILLNLVKNVKSVVVYLEKKGRGFERKKLDFPEDVKIESGSHDPFGSTVFLTFKNFLIPPTLSIFDLEQSYQKPIATKSLPSSFEAKGLRMRQAFAKSKDGTSVPYFWIGPENISLDGAHPTLLYGYGGFEISLLPFYSGTVGKHWLEKGGIYVVANIRGGGERGPSWHQQALKENRHKAYEDFIAVSLDLMKKGITSPQKLAIEGGSNGGLLMGVMLTKRPDLFKAIVCKVPLLDMLRYTKLLAGSSWIGEYGDPEDPKMRAYLKSYSPYHQVKPTGDYPETLFMTSTSDDRVHPGHARKMAKKMKDQGHDLLFYEGQFGGHNGSGGLENTATQEALKVMYLYQKLMND